MEQFVRTKALIGADAVDALSHKKVAVFGLGGVGSAAALALCRAGIGRFLLVDRDVVSVSNINRQQIAFMSTVGMKKTDVTAKMMQDINPQVVADCRVAFYLPETAHEFDLSDCDYIVDAVDTVTAKLELVVRARAVGVPIICAMGTGNKLDPTRFRIADISQTSVCPLARVMRRELKLRGIERLDVVYSDEQPLIKMREPASISFVPPAAGLAIAAHVVKNLLG